MKFTQIKKYFPLIQAAANGKTVQIKGTYSAKDWTDLTDDFVYLFADEDEKNNIEYRIKPKPKLRPWKPEEVPVGAQIRFKKDADNHKCRTLIAFVDSSGFGGVGFSRTFEESLFCGGGDEYSTDGGKTWKPCGVEE